MPHVDEGTLHALLDGALRAEEPARADAVEAHLETCAECRALLEDAAAVRGRSAEVLALLEPVVAAPDFDEVLVRASRESAAPRGGLARQARWTRGVAWAATITIALGTGYLIRDRLVPERTVMTREAAPTTDRARAPAEPPADALRGAGFEEAPDERQSAAADAADAMASMADDAERRDASPTRTFSQAAAAGSGAEAVDAAPEARLEASYRRQRVSEDIERLDLTQLSEISVTAVAPAAYVAAAGPRVVSATEAGEILGSPLLVLARAEVAQVTAETDAEGPVVVSVQRLPDEVEIRVTQRAAAAILPESAGAEEEGGAPLGEPLAPEPAPVARYAPASAAERISALRADVRPAGREAASGAEAYRVVNSVRVRVHAAELVLEGPLPAEVLRLLALDASPYEPRP